jgi:hypothetical protein
MGAIRIKIWQLLWRKFKLKFLQFGIFYGAIRIKIGSRYGGNSNSNSCSSAALMEEIQI